MNNFNLISASEVFISRFVLLILTADSTTSCSLKILMDLSLAAPPNIMIEKNVYNPISRVCVSGLFDCFCQYHDRRKCLQSMDSHGFSVSTHLDLLTWRVIEENVYKLILEFVFYLFEYIEGANRLRCCIQS